MINTYLSQHGFWFYPEREAPSFPDQTSHHEDARPNQDEEGENEETAEERGKRLSKSARRRLMKFIWTMKKETNWLITLRYDFKTNHQMRAIESPDEDCFIVTEDSWERASNDRERFIRRLRYLLPTCWGYWIWEIGHKKKGMHLHIALNIKKLPKSIKEKLRSKWKELINSSDDKSAHFKKADYTETLHSYLYKKDKAYQSYALHCGAPEDSHRCIWNKINKKLIQTEKPTPFSFTEENFTQVIDAVYQVLKKEGSLSKKDEKQFEKLRERTAHCHGFSKKLYSKIKSIFEKLTNEN